jgi:V/A-type H+-transporting ATPase subunit E
MAELKLMIERISDREKNTIQQNLQKTEKQAELKVKQAEEDAQQKFEEEKAKITEQLQYEFSMKENTENVTYRNEILKQKQKMIQKAFKDALKKMNNITSEQFMQIVVSALENVDVTQRVDIFVGEKSTDLMDVAWLNDYLIWNHHVRIEEEPVKNKAGILVRQDNVDYNYFFDELMKENRSELLPYVTNMLFEEE